MSFEHSSDTPVLASFVRSPFGRFGGALAGIRPDDLAAQTIAEALARAGVSPEDVDDVVLGCANQAGEDSRNVARNASLLAGFPAEVPGQTVNRLCGSGMQAVVAAAHAIQVGAASVVVAGGAESMSRAPWVMLKPDSAPPKLPPPIEDSALGWRFPNEHMRELWGLTSLGETAERVAEQCRISRDDQDAFAVRSHRLALAAQEGGTFAEEIAAVKLEPRRGSPSLVQVDEGPRRDTNRELLGKLRPAFSSSGTVTAGNSSSLNDGAAALVLIGEAEAERRGIEPFSRFLGAAAAGVDPNVMGLGPIPATRKLLSRPGMPSIDDLELVELNEAFASQALACVRELKLDPELVNVNGGAIAIGHPLGASGARLVGTLTRELGRRGGRYGLASMCVGVGQGISSLWERI